MFSRSRINSDHFAPNEISNSPPPFNLNYPPTSGKKGQKHRLPIKFHSALNSIGKRDCSGIKPRRLDFNNLQNEKPIGGTLFKNLNNTNLKELFAKGSLRKIPSPNNNVVVTPPKKEAENAKIEMVQEIAAPLLQTVKKTQVNVVEDIKTQSGRKLKDPAVLALDKRSSSFCSSLLGNTQEKGKTTCSPSDIKKKELLINRWMRNDQIFYNNIQHPGRASLGSRPTENLEKGGLFLARSNSDVCTVYESDANFNNRMDAEKHRGNNKFINNGENRLKRGFKAPTPLPMNHKDIINRLEFEERRQKNQELSQICESEEMSSVKFSKRNDIQFSKVTPFDVNADSEDEEFGMRHEDVEFGPAQFFAALGPAIQQDQDNDNSMMDSEEKIEEKVEEEDYHTPKLRHKEQNGALETTDMKQTMHRFFGEDTLEPQNNLLSMMGELSLTKQSESFQELNLQQRIPSLQFPHNNNMENGLVQQNYNRFDSDFEVVSVISTP